MPHGDMEKQLFLDVTCSSNGLSLRGNTVETQSANQQQKSFLSILKSNAVNFFSIYVFVGVIPFMFAGFKFDKFWRSKANCDCSHFWIAFIFVVLFFCSSKKLLF